MGYRGCSPVSQPPPPVPRDERLADAAVEESPARQTRLLVDHPPDLLVSKVVEGHAVFDSRLLHEASLQKLLECADGFLDGPPRCAVKCVEVERAPDHRCRRQQLSCGLAEAPNPRFD